MTLKSGKGVVQGHCKRYHSTALVQFPIRMTQ